MNPSTINMATKTTLGPIKPIKRKPKMTEKRLLALKRKWFFIGLGAGMMLSGVIVLLLK